ncbi:hypothetical protein N7512_003176 [Penicillium capsulatum]|nr:hypothetical protein N7512_003176 [Penicillium capsulatum]
MDELKQLLVKVIRDEYSSTGSVIANKSAESSPSNEREKRAQVVDEVDEVDLKSPICTTPDDFKSFEKWAATPEFKIVVETWDKDGCKYNIAEPM